MCEMQNIPADPHLLSVQSSTDAHFSTAGVDGELLQRVTAHDGVPQQVVDGAVLVSCAHLEGTRWKVWL